ncbi:MAG: adenylyltransferase/cytidyltransferase family protein [Endomicrobiales bacterium]|nr:adenylyltransferase/cytidyltransferase family protein [Endomicrobiales bacterium]
MENKIKSAKDLSGILKRLKKRGKRIVFTNGCFDVLHVGHLRLFKKARSYGDALVVAVNSDRSLRKLKGPKRPLVPQKERAELVAGFEPVDFVTVFGEETPLELIKKLKPQVLVKGGDYSAGEIVGRHFVKKVVRFPVVRGRSTTGLIKKIVAHYGR